MTEQPTTWPPDAPTDAAYLCFSTDHDAEAAAQRFQRVHGQPPEWLFEALGLLWTGPVPEGEAARGEGATA